MSDENKAENRAEIFSQEVQNKLPISALGLSRAVRLFRFWAYEKIKPGPRRDEPILAQEPILPHLMLIQGGLSGFTPTQTPEEAVATAQELLSVNKAKPEQITLGAQKAGQHPVWLVDFE